MLLSCGPGTLYRGKGSDTVTVAWLNRQSRLVKDSFIPLVVQNVGGTTGHC